jgi:hypothetical protein
MPPGHREVRTPSAVKSSARSEVQDQNPAENNSSEDEGPTIESKGTEQRESRTQYKWPPEWGQNVQQRIGRMLKGQQLDVLWEAHGDDIDKGKKIHGNQFES